ncbi:hypothetical protein [Hwangdonia lutea]|uniref:STAS/SEC14 domain-containing protein n=1 Tax=Hwangdonia lutea TaxID=3075823 RepID=A0AA97ELU2_9FLAO|nr:hypothetical protein [Hwangdonia sp. SCSIO 19198]WOD43632.1 hypothetical protein RNZ46_16730 [Hwangdonia sp. SCSIO 19198]
MVSIKETYLYSEVIKEFSYSFGNIYIFDGFVVSEINQGQIITWDKQAKLIVDDLSAFLGTNGADVIYISNRINSYSVVALDWLKFFKHNYSLKAYCMVSKNKSGTLSAVIERLFYTKKIKHFNSLFEAVNCIKQGVIEIA